MLSFNILYSQERNMYDENIYINCQNEKLNWKKVELNSIEYKYTLISKNYFASDKDVNYYNGLIILPIDKNEKNRNIIEELLKLISVKEDLFEITAIKNCESQKLFLSSFLTDEQKIALKNNIIGRFRLGLKN